MKAAPSLSSFDPAGKLADIEWHPHVAAIIRVERSVFTRNAKTGLLRGGPEKSDSSISGFPGAIAA